MSEDERDQPQRRRSARIVALEEKKEKEKALAAERKKNLESNNKNKKGKGKAIVVEEDYDFIDDSDDDDDNDEQYPPSRKKGRKCKTLHQLIASSPQEKAIGEHAKKVFHGLSRDSKHSLNRKRRGKRPLGRPKSSGRLRQILPKLGRSYGATPMEPDLERRHTYRPSTRNSLLSHVMNAPKQNLQFAIPAYNYQDSLVRFVQGLGPTAQSYAAKRLENLRLNQIMFGETPRPNPLASFLVSTGNTTAIIEPPPPPLALPPPLLPPPPTTQACRGAPSDMQYSLLSNRPLTIPGFSHSAPQETGNVNLKNKGKGKQVLDDQDSWDAYAANLLGDIFISGSSGLNGESSSYRMANPVDQNLFSNLLLGSSSFQGASHNVSNEQNQWMQMMQLNNTLAGTSNLRQNFESGIGGSSSSRRDAGPSGSSRIQCQVWPTRVISGPKDSRPKPQVEPMSTVDKQLSEQSLLGQSSTARDQYLLSGYNLSGQSLLSRQTKPTNQPLSGSNFSEHSLLSNQLKPTHQPLNCYDISENCHDISELCLLSQQKHIEQPVTGYNLPCQSFTSQQKPEDPVTNYNLLAQSILSQSKPKKPVTEYNLARQSLMSQLKPEEAMTSYNLSGQSILPQQKSSEPMTGYTLPSGQSFLPQQKPTETMMGYNFSGQSSLTQQKPAEANSLTGYILSSGQSLLPQQKPTEPMMGYNLSGQSSLTQQKPADAGQMTGYNLSQAAKWTQQTQQDTSNLYGLSNPHQTGDFQAMLGSTCLNNISFPDQANLYTPPAPAMFGYTNDFQMQALPEPEPSPLNPLGLFPQQVLNPSSSSRGALEMPMGHDAMNLNFYGGNALQGQPAAGGQATHSSQLLWDDKHLPNLALGL